MTGRLFFVEVVRGEYLVEHAVDQWTREIPVKAVRGRIVDVNGKVLADNRQSFAVYVRPRCVSDFKAVAA
ncbi:MAG: hypothetical protein ILP02_01100, partial [Clostridia bacterium]|nr:hypothetical protein [Clostridia bacterium]